MGSKPRLLVFASGTPTGGGSGFEKLVENQRREVLDAEIVGVISNHQNGGVRERANRLGIKFRHFRQPYEEHMYRLIVEVFDAEWVALSGWLNLTKGLDPRTTFNIHPGPLPRFGGPGMYGHHVHQAVIAAYYGSDITASAVSMHFVTEPKGPDDYDKGPVFFSYPVVLHEGDTAETIGARVNAAEHEWQSRITNLVVHGGIGWDGKNPSSMWGAQLNA